MHKIARSLLLTTTAFALALSLPAGAQAASTKKVSKLEQLEQQLIALQKEVAELKAEKAKAVETAETAKPAPAQAQMAPSSAMPQTVAAAPSVTAQPQQVATAAPQQANDQTPKSMGDKLQASIKDSTGVKLSLGGFFDMTSLSRSRNEASDTASSWTTIPFDNQHAAHEREYRGTARNTRISLAAAADPDADTSLKAYLETDFNGTGLNSSPAQTNNYTPRMRQGWGMYERNDWGLHVLGGQAWSLATQNTKGMLPRTENAPMVADSGYLPGFVYTRAPQMRIVKDFDDKKVWAGLSFESPNTVYAVSSSTYATTSPASTNYGANAVSTALGSSVTSNDIAPDVVGKLAFDPGFGHYEIFGMGRAFHDRYNNVGNTIYAGSGGASVFFKTLSGKLDLTATAIAGQGIGRYLAGQLPDVVFTPSGSMKATTGYGTMAGIVGHPTPTWDLYTFAGVEQMNRESYDGQGSTTSTGVGYGNVSLNNSVCYDEGSQTCYAQTRRLWQVTGGTWKSLYKGNYGNFQIGLQNSMTRRDTFSGADGSQPHAYENVSLMSFRFTPSF